LPDPEESLYSRPEYAIRLANKDCWHPATGYNDLNMPIDIDPTLNLPSSKSNIRFVKQ
jgi:hypothetical protein